MTVTSGSGRGRRARSSWHRVRLRGGRGSGRFAAHIKSECRRDEADRSGHRAASPSSPGAALALEAGRRPRARPTQLRPQDRRGRDSERTSAENRRPSAIGRAYVPRLAGSCLCPRQGSDHASLLGLSESVVLLRTSMCGSPREHGTAHYAHPIDVKTCGSPRCSRLVHPVHCAPRTRRVMAHRCSCSVGAMPDDRRQPKGDVHVEGATMRNRDPCRDR